MKKHIVIALAVVSIILGLVISCEEPQVNLPSQYTTPTIKGTLSIPTSQNVSASEVFVKVIDSDGNTVKVQKANADGSFVVQNLNAGKKYSVLFTSVEPEFSNRAVGGSSGVGGWLYDVVPAVQEGNNVGNVKLKPLGTIKGNALIDGESEHYDITVYIPGTSYIAKTDKDGSFSIYNVPEGKYTLRYTLDDHLPVMVKDVMLVCPEDVEKPEVKVKKVTLKSSLGSVEGRAILGDSNDSTGVKVNLESEDKSLTYPAFTSKDGHYTISGIQPGMYRVIVSYEGYTSQMSSYFSVASGTLTKIDTLIELYSTSGFLKGSVSLNDSDTKSGISVTIRSKENGNTFTVMTDGNGDFSKRLKPGIYTVDFSHSGYSSYSVEATVVENNTTTLSPVILYSVYGTITGSSFSPEETVTLLDYTGNPIQTLQSSNDCTYKFSRIQSGTYSVRFSKTGFSSNTISDVVVTPSKTTTINGVELKSLYGTLKGVAGSEGDGVSLMKEGVVVETVTVDSSRQYLFTGIEPGSYSVRFSREGYTPYESETVAVAAASETSINGKVLISIYGTIVGASYSENETVSLIKDGIVLKTVVTTEDRSYSFTSVDPGTYKVRFSKDKYTSYESDAFVLNAGNELTIDGKELISLYGSIYGKSNSEGETVSLTKGESVVSTVVTSSDNSYSFSNIIPGEYKVTFSKDDYKSSPATVVSVEAGKSVELNGPVLISMYGSVDGKSYSGEEMVTLIDEKGSQYLSIVSNSDGSYSFPKVLVGTYSVKFSKSGFASHIVSDVVVAPSEKTTINGTALKSSYGTVKGVAGSEGDGVSLMKDGVVVETVTVDSSRQYLFTGIEPGSYSVRFSREGYTPYESETVAVAAASETSINGKVLISIYGTIVGASYSENETVSLIKDGIVLKTVVTTEDRSYSFTSVDPGTYKVRFSKEGYTSYESEEVTVLAGIESTVNGKALVSIYGTIKGTSASEGETVYLVRNGVQVDSSTTLENKEYIFTNIQPGEYSIRFTKNGYKTYESEAITVKAGESYVIDGQKLVSMYGAVAGFVFLSGSDDYSGVTVTLRSNESMTSSFVETTAADGSFRFSNIAEPGIYLLTYSKDGYVTDNTKSVEVTVGSVASAGAVTLKSTASTLKGTIQLEGASSYENVTILFRNDTNQYTTTTDQKGGYILNRVLPGTYTLLASKDGYVTSTPLEIVVEPSSEKTIEDRILSVAIRSVTGKVTLELLSDYSGSLVTATNLSDNTLVYSAITNSNGDFTLAGMKPGEYSVVISCNGYRTITLPTINIVASTTASLPVTNMLINRGTVSGTATLEGRSSSEGIKVELLKGSDIYADTTTDESGNYSFYIPQGNYSGVRYSKTDFASSSVSKNIALFADNYVSMGDTELKATHNTITGKVDVLTTDDESGVTISFDGVDSITAYTTTTEGEFSFEHIPVGSYIMRFKRTDCSDITVPVNVTASDVINLGTVTITPNTATIKGTVVLKDGLSSEGVTVSIDMGGKTLQTTTDSSGRYEIGGVSIADEYTVTYSKNGWDTNTQTISPKLGLLEIREMPEISLVDTTAPVLKSVTINNGANTAADRNIVLHIDAEDGGSGLKTMLVYDYSNPQYLGSYSSLADWTFESSNGLKTVYVKVSDRAGNESNTISAQVTLTDQKKEVKGVLKGDDLAWTKEMSPYLVTGNLLVEKDDTLTIQPGVDVQFSGDYYLQVEGKLSAIGTEDERIKIYGIDNAGDNWDGMKFINDNDSTLSYVDISGHKNGIVGYCDIDHALITSNGWAVGIKDDYDPNDCLRGSLTDSTVNGNVSVAYDDVKGNTIDGNTVYLYYNPFVGDNTISGSTTIQYSNIDGNLFNGSKLDTWNSFVYNNTVNSSTVYSHDDIQKYVTYNGCTLYLFSSLYNVQFNNCSFPMFASNVNDSNFINCGPITVNSERRVRDSFICFGNYWGDINTVEIRSKGEGQNLSFINDYYDDFNETRIDYSGYKESAVDNAGYHGQEPDGPYSGYSIGDKGPAGGLVFYDKGHYSDGWRYLEAAPEDVGRFVFGYYRPDGTNNNVVGTVYPIGTGRYNTEKLVEFMDIEGKAYSDESGTSTAEYAAKKCLDYSYGGYDDWFLPSTDELNLMYQNIHKKGLGSFANNYYWTSSEGNNYFVCLQGFIDGDQGSLSRYSSYYVRAVRAL